MFAIQQLRQHSTTQQERSTQQVEEDGDYIKWMGRGRDNMNRMRIDEYTSGWMAACDGCC